jgi:transcriptional repressor BetI
MPKVGMEPVRRRQIIAAARACIHRDGISHASASRIAREAGIAPALILHYFEDKDALLLETFRSMYREFTTDMRRRLGMARSPQERLLALLEAFISPATLTPEAVSTWLAIYSTMRNYPLLERIEHSFDRRFLSNLRHALAGMGLPPAEARDIAEELSIFIDGLWQNVANPVTFTPERARQVLYRYLNLRLPGQGLTPPPDDTARRAAEDAALSPEARQFLKDNLPISPMHLSEANIAEMRQQFAQLYGAEARASVKALGLRLAQIDLGGVPALRVAPRAASPAPLRVFYLFGGGYATGEPESDLPVSGALARRLDAAIAAPRYRLAPEHRYPAALDDALTAWRAFAAVAEGPLFLVGESAGGGLALALAQAIRDRGLPMPAAMALLSPWVDLTQALPSANDGFDPTLARRNLQDYARLYAGRGTDLSAPGLSPLRGDLRGLPPMILTTGSRDILREQVHALARTVAAAGGLAELHDWPGLWHVFEFYRALPEAAASLDRIAAFLRRHDTPPAKETA